VSPDNDLDGNDVGIIRIPEGIPGSDSVLIGVSRQSVEIRIDIGVEAECGDNLPGSVAGNPAFEEIIERIDCTEVP
jgi:hypothetical protein